MGFINSLRNITMRQQRDEYPPLAENIGFGKWHIRYDVQPRTSTDGDTVRNYYYYEEFELIFDDDNQILSGENISSELVNYALNQISKVNNDNVTIIHLESGVRTSASDAAVNELIREGLTIITVR